MPARHDGDARRQGQRRRCTAGGSRSSAASSTRSPATTNKTWFKATETGTFKGQCAELCGTGHAAMTAKVTVVEPRQYLAWVERQKTLIDAGAQARAEAAQARSRRRAHGDHRSHARTRADRPRSSSTACPSAAPAGSTGSRTTDHKKIGILYLFTTAFFFLVGGVEALLMRIQLGSPDNTFLDPTTYNQLFTLHGTTMIFMVIVPIAAGLRELPRPAHDRRARHGVPAPQHAVVVAADRGRRGAVRIDLLGRAAGRLDRPTRRSPAATSSPATGSTRGSSACTSSGISSVLGAINFIVTIHNMRAPGHDA